MLIYAPFSQLVAANNCRKWLKKKVIEMDITEMRVGNRAEITGYLETEAGYRAKLLALGLTRGATIELTGVAPMGDPLRIKVRGFELSLRRSEAKILKLKAVN